MKTTAECLKYIIISIIQVYLYRGFRGRGRGSASYDSHGGSRSRDHVCVITLIHHDVHITIIRVTETPAIREAITLLFILKSHTKKLIIFRRRFIKNNKCDLNITYHISGLFFPIYVQACSQSYLHPSCVRHGTPGQNLLCIHPQ